MWISCKDKLPEEDKCVIGYYGRGNWIDDNNPIMINYVLVQLRKGISQEERNLLSDFDDRKREFQFGDEAKNNLTPYAWEGAPGNYHGQDITHWHPLPEPTFLQDEFLKGK